MYGISKGKFKVLCKHLEKELLANRMNTTMFNE